MQLSDLQYSAWTQTVLADLTREAAHAGATLAPTWWMRGPNLADGAIHSDDDTAIRELDLWRTVFGSNGILDSFTPTIDGKLRREWQISVTVSDVNIRLTAIVPITVETLPHNAPALYVAQPERWLVAA